MWFWHQTLAATTGSIGARRSHKNLHAPNLHTSYFNGNCHDDFGAACSMWEIRAEICLGRNFYRLRWGPYSNLFHAGAASFRSTCGIQGHQHKRIYSIVCINEISVQIIIRTRCPNLCLVDSALLARERKLAHMRDVVSAHCRYPGRVLAHSVQRTESLYNRIACLPSTSSSS